MLEVTDSTFETEVLNAEGVVVVDYYAGYCTPCKNLLPRLENVNGRAEKGKIVKLDVEANFESTLRNQIRTVPTLIVYKDGEVVQALRGCSQLSEDAIEGLLAV